MIFRSGLLLLLAVDRLSNAGAVLIRGLLLERSSSLPFLVRFRVRAGRPFEAGVTGLELKALGGAIVW